MKKIFALAALAAISATASAAGPNLIVDGSFEAVSQGAGTWSLTTDAPWVTTAVSNNSTVGLEVRNNAVGAAKLGNNYIELDGNENDKISQSFATVVGQTYNVSFWFSDRTGVAAGSEGWALSVGSLVAAVNGGGFNTSGGNQWQLFTGSFKATSTTTTFALSGTGTSDSYGTSIDGISVASAVPEPATLGLLAAGLAVIGLSARRRQKQ